ncbi:dystrotelin-like isoform X2 [Micropterus salmoides]|uniref:dystrotelin-like isoform X2 n=1 Tax=Micropterus salmoides TaxID=27706 RepID=UPI0018EE2924|nr:dystrotelin-like isoform X2 [Micropterus salmoides]
MKLQSLQKLCHLHVVSLRHIVAALRAVGGATLQQDVGLNRQEVTRTLNRMFHSASQEVSGHVTDEAPEETCSLMFRLFDRTQAGSVSAASLQTALIALSAETLLDKYRGEDLSVGNDSSLQNKTVSFRVKHCFLQSKTPFGVKHCFLQNKTVSFRVKHFFFQSKTLFPSE